ncbi:MAG TPA: TIM-barrel domain-containing protein [Candidatus Acidoferrales bacterium]|nr:TIM-barrel domain-containing protein [Candidatus Acidoferrales bacterium]
MASKRFPRRQVLKALGAACGAGLIPIDVSLASSGAARGSMAANGLRVAGQNAEIEISAVSEHTFRISVRPVANGELAAIPHDGSLVRQSWGEPVAKLSGDVSARIIRCGNFRVRVEPEPLAFIVDWVSGDRLQQFQVDETTGAVSFLTGNAPLLGLGEGGKQFDRRGTVESMRHGEGVPDLATAGARVPIPWLVSTAGWAIFFHQPYGTFDFTGAESKFQPAVNSSPLPLDLFFVASSEPATILREYARLTGLPEMPPLWSLGYQQSHRTLESREAILDEAATFRSKKLPCDALIYLGTGFCPSGWNTANGSFDWNERVFDDPPAILKKFHEQNFRAVVHVVILSRKLTGSVTDPCELTRFDEEQAGCYWDAHLRDFAMGVDGWWPDEGDPLDIPSRLNRNRMYWEGPQQARPNVRPYALHRNGYAGMQRYASFLWSGDTLSKWETLKTQVAVAINTSLTGIPYWGSDIGGFVPTKEFTAELYLRWFQFGAFCTLFRCHGRAWMLRLPWGWDMGTTGPQEMGRSGASVLPAESELHNTQVEPICRKYLNLRYQMLPYLYSMVRECTTTGLPIMRSLWLHDPNDPAAMARDDEYLWGKDILVAPVFEKGATSRQVYLPKGAWHDFWTGDRVEGGREVTRPVDLETIPLYIRAGGIVPLGPVKQYVAEKVDGPLSVTIYPGADGSFLLYEDDGESFNYRHGEWMGIEMGWDDQRRAFGMKLAEGSRMLPPLQREMEIRLLGQKRNVVFEGHPVEVKF